MEDIVKRKLTEEEYLELEDAVSNIFSFDVEKLKKMFDKLDLDRYKIMTWRPNIGYSTKKRSEILMDVLASNSQVNLDIKYYEKENFEEFKEIFIKGVIQQFKTYRSLYNYETKPDIVKCLDEIGNPFYEKCREVEKTIDNKIKTNIPFKDRIKEYHRLNNLGGQYEKFNFLNDHILNTLQRVIKHKKISIYGTEVCPIKFAYVFNKAEYFRLLNKFFNERMKEIIRFFLKLKDEEFVTVGTYFSIQFRCELVPKEDVE